VKLTIHLHLLPRLRMHGAIPSLPIISSWRLLNEDNVLWNVVNFSYEEPLLRKLVQFDFSTSILMRTRIEVVQQVL
jgi:hypothetical protein